MDAIDILGSLLGSKSKSGSPGGNILKDILGGGRTGTTPSKPSSPSRSTTPARQHPHARRPTSISDSARSLEELLNVSSDHHQSRRRSSPQQRTPQTQRAPEKPRTPEAQRTPERQREGLNEQAAVLVRAMVSAAKSDGQITKDEQDKILQQLGQADPASIQFLRAEFAKPVDVRELAWNIPRGMEEQAYTVSLIAIDLDEQKEAEYLADLCQGLRMDPKRCNEIHRSFGAPVIFQG